MRAVSSPSTKVWMSSRPGRLRAFRFDIRQNALEPAHDGIRFRLREDAGVAQHGRVGDGAQDVSRIIRW
jgi:hypothetical protein